MPNEPQCQPALAWLGQLVQLERQLQQGAITRQDGRHLQRPLLHGEPLNLDRPRQRQVIRAQRVAAVYHPDTACRQVNWLHLDRFAQLGQLPQGGVRGAVGGDEAVEAEIAFVGHVAKVAAVGPV